MTWAEAETNCQSLQGNLASVYNAEHIREIHEVMQRAGHEHGQVWVGGHDTAENPSWSWSGYTGVMRSLRITSTTVYRQPLKIICRDAWMPKQCDAQLPSVCSISIMRYLG